MHGRTRIYFGFFVSKKSMEGFFRGSIKNPILRPDLSPDNSDLNSKVHTKPTPTVSRRSVPSCPTKRNLIRKCNDIPLSAFFPDPPKNPCQANFNHQTSNFKLQTSNRREQTSISGAFWKNLLNMTLGSGIMQERPVLAI